MASPCKIPKMEVLESSETSTMDELESSETSTDDELETKCVISWPTPPIEYADLYTPQNVQQNLVPRPPPPIQGTYSMFGRQYGKKDDLVRSLEANHFKRLHKLHFDRRKELKKMNHSILANFLDLIDILIRSPESPKRLNKIDDLFKLFIHVHHLINEIRPHQARETLRIMMEMQKRQRVQMEYRFQEPLKYVRDMVNAAFAALRVVEDNVDLNTEVAKKELSSHASSNTLENDREFQLDRIMCEIVDAMD